MKKNRVYAGIDLDALRYKYGIPCIKILKEGNQNCRRSSRQMLTGMGDTDRKQKQSRTFRMYGDLPWQLRMKRRC